MPIDFRCPHCQKLLRTQDDTAGKQARCPVCGTLVPIPDPDLPPPIPASWPGQPLAAPPSALPADSPVESVSGVAPALEIGDLFSTAWRIFSAQMGICVGGFLLAAFVFQLVPMIFGLPMLVILADTQRPGDPDPFFFIAGIAWWLGANLLVSLLEAGQVVFSLKIARGEPATVGDFFSGWRWLPQLFFVFMIVSLATLLGGLLFVVPGFIIASMWSVAVYAVIDRGATTGDALDTSQRLTSGQRLQIVGLFFLVWVINVAASLPCYLGLIFFYPWKGILWAVIYLRLSGQKVAAPPA